MPEPEKHVNGFHFMPPSLSAWIGNTIPDSEYEDWIPWTPLKKPLSEVASTRDIAHRQDVSSGN